MQKPTFIHALSPPTTTTTQRPVSATTTTPPPPKSDTALQATTTECPPNNTVQASTNKNFNNNNLLKKLASSHYQSYTTALTVTIAVGCFLLLLNILIFAGIYHQRDRGNKKKKKQKELLETGSCSSSSGENYDKQGSYDVVHQMAYDSCKNYEMSRGNNFECKSVPNYIGEYSCEKRTLGEVQMTEISLQDFKCSPVKRKESHDNSSMPPDVTSIGNQNDQGVNSPTIPEPPPPPKNQPPTILCNQAGILRSHGVPTTPGTMKKRVQIQEISV